MGWKSLKDEYGILHIVTADDQAVHIGHLKDFRLASIDRGTGAIMGDQGKSFLQTHYPRLAQASDEQRKTVMDRPDRFQRALPVYSVEYGEIIKNECEQRGYPNVTKDGKVMYPGVFTDSFDEAVGWAKFDLIYARNLKSRERNEHYDAIERGNLKDNEEAQDRSYRLDAELNQLESQLNKLERDYRLIDPIDPFDRDDLVVSMGPSN